ncbi:MAG: DUF5818 domain-containing protein [Acidobacteriota bacterium]|nr:DUF5818 domain-containing protein [Acidobacteriota bacterium]
MKRNVTRMLCGLVALTAVAVAAAGPRKFTGVITDSMCATADHSHMKMGPTDGECAKACVGEHDARYVLYDGRNAYTLNARRTPEKFAGKNVTVTGTLDANTKTIRVDSIAAGK